MREGFVHSSGERLYWREYGAGDALLVPLAALLEEDLTPLRESARVILFDGRGRGRSSRMPTERCSVASEVEDVELVARGLKLDRFALLGWSYLGLIACRYAAAHPDRVTRLVLVSPFGPMPPEHPSVPADVREDVARRRSELAARADPAAAAALEQMRAAGLEEHDGARYCHEHRRTATVKHVADPAALTRWKSDYCRFENEWPTYRQRSLAAALASLGPEWDLRSDARRVRAPTLVVHGGSDGILFWFAEQWARSLPEARLLELPEVGHFPFLEAPEAFFNAVASFLEGDWPAGARQCT